MLYFFLLSSTDNVTSILLWSVCLFQLSWVHIVSTYLSYFQQQKYELSSTQVSRSVVRCILPVYVGIYVLKMTAGGTESWVCVQHSWLNLILIGNSITPKLITYNSQQYCKNWNNWHQSHFATCGAETAYTS